MILALLLLANTPALALADPTYTPAVAKPTSTVEPSMPPAAVKPSPIRPTPAAPEVPKVTRTAPAVYWMFSNRNRTWYTHHDKAWLETYVRGLDSVRYAAPANCANGTCPR